jgi:hypothetical protein
MSKTYMAGSSTVRLPQSWAGQKGQGPFLALQGRASMPPGVRCQGQNRRDMLTVSLSARYRVVATRR